MSSVRAHSVQSEMARQLRGAGMSASEADAFGLFLALCVEKRSLDDVVTRYTYLMPSVAAIIVKFGFNGAQVKGFVSAAKDIANSL